MLRVESKEKLQDVVWVLHGGWTEEGEDKCQRFSEVVDSAIPNRINTAPTVQDYDKW